MISGLFEPEALLSLVTLTVMEIVLGIDNIVFLSITVVKLPKDEQEKARKLGISLALGLRLLLLFGLSWVMGLTAPLFSLFGQGFSVRDLILLGGGLFLVAKSTHEIHMRMERASAEHSDAPAKESSFGMTIVQILALDIIFSLDSVITAVGMANHLPVMILAMVIAVGVMFVSAGKVSDFIERHPTAKMLALSFLLLIGFMLVLEGMGKHIDKGYIYFAMGFAFTVELLNMRARKRSRARAALDKPVPANRRVQT